MVRRARVRARQWVSGWWKRVSGWWKRVSGGRKRVSGGIKVGNYWVSGVEVGQWGRKVGNYRVSGVEVLVTT